MSYNATLKAGKRNGCTKHIIIYVWRWIACMTWKFSNGLSQHHQTPPRLHGATSRLLGTRDDGPTHRSNSETNLSKQIIYSWCLEKIVGKLLVKFGSFLTSTGRQKKTLEPLSKIWIDIFFINALTRNHQKPWQKNKVLYKEHWM